MNILNAICFGSAALISVVTFVFVIFLFCTSIYACFSKKVEGKLVVKIFIAILSGCVCPWLVRLIVYFISHIGV